MAKEKEDGQNKPIHAPETSGPEVKNQLAGIEMSQELVEQTEEFWASRSKEERRQYYLQIDLNYHTIVDEFFKLADRSVDKFSKFTKSHMAWRRWITILAGVLAILNIIVAYTADYTNILVHLSLLAAVFAATIAIFSNLENLHNYAERAQSYREVREMALTTAREFEMLWHVYVRPFSDSPMACINAAKIYRQIIEKDQEIRGKTKELTKAKRVAHAAESGSGSE